MGSGNEIEILFMRILEQNGMAAWAYDMERREIIKLGFSRGRDGMGDSEEGIVGSPQSIIDRGTVCPEDADAYLQIYEKIHGGEAEAEARVRLWDGEQREYVWNQVTATVVGEGGSRHAIFTSRDITEARQIEQHFIEESRYWDEMASAMLSTGRRNLSTGEWEETTIHGIEVALPDEIRWAPEYRRRIGYFLYDVAMTDEDSEKLGAEHLKEQYEKGIHDITIEFNAKTMERGEPIRVKVDCRVLRRPETGELVAFYYESDITKEFCIQSNMSSVITYENELMGILFAGSNAVYSMGKKGRTSLPQLISNNYDKVCESYLREYAHEQDMAGLIEALQLRCILEKLEQGEFYTVEFDVHELSGEIRRKEMRYTYLNREEMLISFARRDIQDIVREEREKQERLEEALNLAERASSAKSEFLSRMSHEMRTPMNAIIGLVALAEGETDDPEAMRDYLEKINVSSHMLLNLINDVLDMAKIESGKLELRSEPCRFSELMDGIETVIRPLCEQKDIVFSAEGDPDQTTVLADRLRFQQVVINLLSNAAKFTPDGGRVTLKYSCKKGDSQLDAVVEVADNGAGMSEEFQEKMFQPFTQEQRDDVPSVQGTGLGLAISKTIIDKMGGTIRVESKIGQGTRFVIHVGFPIAAAAEKRGRDASKDEERIKGALAGRQILLVEDHPMNQLIARRILENNGMRVTTVGNGQEAVRLFATGQAARFDAVLMDLRMPVMDGITATERIRALPDDKARNVPIIAMTANAFEEDARRTRAAGMNCHLAKPIEPQKLLSTLADCIPAGEGI